MDIEVGAGLAQWDHLHDGLTWYEDGHPWDAKTVAPSFTTGERGDVPSWTRNPITVRALWRFK